MFPFNSSQTIIECFLTATQNWESSLDRTKRTVSIQERNSMENRNTKRYLVEKLIATTTPKYGK
jgi:hypothetical protein